MVAGAPLAVVLAYGALGVGLALVPDGGGAAPAEGVALFVCSNGIHTDLILPVRAAGIDWRDRVQPAHLPVPALWNTHLAFGWGDRGFYLETRRLSDLQPATAWAALFGGGPTVVHVEATPEPSAAANCARRLVSEPAYRRLAARVEAGFRRDLDGASLPLFGRSYGPADVFYEGTGHYSPFLTCNVWTAEALKAADVEVGLWTPFADGVMRWLR